MTQKHFEAFAAEIKRLNTIEHKQGERSTFQRDIAWNDANLVISVAKKFNPNFDEAWFRKACGLL